MSGTNQTGVPSMYPLAVVPGITPEEQKHFSAGMRALREAPCDHCAFNKNVKWRNVSAAEVAISRAFDTPVGKALVCHRTADLKNDEYIPCEHSQMCAGAIQFKNGIKGNVFESKHEMMAHHAAELFPR